jgi:hypothetical protein
MSFLFAGAVGTSANSVGSEFSDALKELAEPYPPGDRFKAAINRAARVSGLSYWRAFNIWYGKARRIDAHEAEQIKEALRIKREKALANEFHELKTRIAKFEAALLVQGNPDVHRDNASPAGFGVRRSR